MITEIDSHLVNLHRDYVWAHLTAADVKHIECIGSEYMPLSRMAEQTFSCEIAGEAMTLKPHLQTPFPRQQTGRGPWRNTTP